MAQDVFSKMAEEQWILNEDGYLNVDTNVKEIVYHPYLNVILICTYSGEVKVLDVNSGVILQSSYLSALNLTEVKCKYIPSLDRVLFTDGQALGVRSDYNGVLLLDSILQKTTGDSKEEVKLELPLSEAIILKESFSSNLTSVDHIINELTDVILKAQKYLRRGIKAQKWNTVCLNIPLEDLRVAAADIVSILLTKKEHVPELGVASAVQERLADLLGEKVNASDRKSMASEWRRRETYSEWPHMDYKWALPDQMAQAGFYHQPNSSGDDRAMCFTCTVCLVCWERTDEPCSEHERHSPTCPFVVGEYTQNVPLSVTHATCPAVDCTHRGLAVEVVGDSSEPHLVPTATADGLVSVFDVAGKVKRAHSFYVTQFDSFVLDRFTKDFGQVGILAIAEHRKYPVEKKITSLCIVSTDSPTKNPRSVRPSLVCGLSFTTHLDKFPKITHMDSDDAPITRLYLVVYDFLYHTDPYRPDPFDDASPVLAPCPPDDEDDATPSDAEKVSNLFNLNSSDLGGEDLPGYNLMKQLSSFYESFVPGESDEVFLPPPQKPHSGPRVLLFDEFKTDSSSTGQPMTNGQLTGMEGELSISDHINELKNTQSPKKLSYSRPVQCVGMPEQCRSLEGAEISAVLPTPDRRHVLVVVRGAATAVGGGAGGFLVLYALDASDRAMRLDERPVATRKLAGPERPEEVHLLPPIERLGAPEGNAVMVCADGVVRIISLATLRTVCFAQIEDDAFVSVAYCNSLDRLCASTKKGSLHFYALTNADNESSDDHDDDDPFGAHAHDASTGVSQQLDALDNSQLARHFRRPAAPVAPPDLRDFRSLCDFEPLKTGYCVVVPPCWSEFQQSLRQRRQPNAQKEDIGTAIINTHGRKYCEGDGEQTMKTWRLLTDITTWDEHIFEITLPNATLLGHLDVHFTLQPSSCAPQVEVTLLRQNKSGIGHKKDVKFSVDETVTIEMLQWVDNPVVSQEYLRAHNAEILVGPIDVSSYLDLTEQCGIITMTSPKLYKTKVRNLLLHVRAVNSKDDVARSRPRPDKPAAAAATGVDKLGLASPRKADFYMGCDVIHELSVALHTLRASQVPNDRTQRSLMLESDVFAQALVLTALSDASPEVINHSLDILDWIAATRLTRNRSNNGEAPNQQFEFLGVVEENLASLTKKCLLHGGRSIAHKCVRLIMTCCRGAENIGPARADAFSSAVLAALLSLLDSIEEIDSSAGLQWLFALLSKVTPMAEEAAIVDRCVGLLGRVAGELSGRSNPYHLLLRGRYGLYGTPMEPELFDVEPPQCTRGEASLLASQTGADLGAAQYSFNRESINPKDVLSTSPTKLKSKNIVSQRIIHGLIETQPLHFACASASEGTRVERADAFAAAPLSYLSALLPVPATGGGGATSNDSPAGKKEYMEKLMDSVGKMMKAQLKGKTPLLVGGAGGGGSGTSNANDGGGGGGGSKWVSIFSEPDNIEADVDGKLGEDYGVDDTVFINITKKLEEASGITGTLHPPTTTSAPPTMAPPNLLPWQQLLAPPPRQVIVVERMHSGARRHVMLDFGRPVLLTDVLVPACADLVSVAVDVWLDGEDADEGRLAVAADIGSRSLLLSDLQPPPLCQFVKITVVGRYGMSTMRSRIPLGHFYGHLVVLPDEVPPHLAAHTTDPDKQSAILGKLFEDLSCRYSLACSRLKELLRPLLAADLGNAVHLAAYIGVARECGGGSNVGGGAEHGKVAAAYQETVKLQHQLNIVKNVIGRVERSLGGCNAPTQRSEPSTDKLAAIAENLLEILLSMDATAEMPRALCQQFFLGLCMTQPPRLQLLAAIFLERHCGRAAYWGDFLADTLADAFATSCSSRFPQDRLFVLLAYLSRRSPEKSAVIDAAMRVVHDALRPLTGDRRPLLATTVDLPLISWQLMYLSLQLSLCKVQGGSQHRWNWVMGEMVGGKGADNPKGSNKKKNCKRMAQPGNSGGMQSYPTYSSVVINAETQSYQQKLKSLMVQDKLFRLKHFKKVQDDNRTNKDKKDQAADRPSAALRMPQIVDSGHCLLVAKGLLRLILCMDHSSSADMLLLSFKVVSKLVTLGKLQLGQLLEESELLELITFCISCRIPWAPFALTCFLQDAMELTQLKADEVEMETETSSSASWSPNEAPNDADTTPDNFNMEMLEPAIKPTKPSASIISNNTFPPLPSVYESEDSEFEELLDDLQKVRCTANSKSPKAAAAPAAAPNSGLSCAADSRLELGVQALSEIDLKKLVLRNTQVLLQAATAEMGHKESDNGLNPWPGPVEVPAAEAPMTNQAMLNRCFTSLFEDLQNQDASKIEHILQLWLTLNNYSKFLPSTIPQIALDAQSVRNLISTMAWTPGLSLTAWCSALRTLTLVCNMNGGKKWMDLSGMADTIVTHPDFVQLFLSLLSGTGPVFNGKTLAGPSLCRALHDLLVRLQMRCDIVSPVSQLGNLLKTSLLKVVYQLAQPSGSVASRLGPLDAQCKLLQTMLYLYFINTDLSIAMSTLESTATLVYSYVLNKEKIECGSVGEKQGGMANTFSDIFASVLGPDTNKDDRPVSYEDLLILMLKLMGKLVQTPLPDQLDAMDTESATDESKAERILHAFLPNSLPCFADIVLQNHPTVIRLCRCLAACKSSSLCMLANVTEKVAISNMSDPNTVGDAIFHLLTLLARKASAKELLLNPLLAFLNQTPQLSEPLLWFVLQVLENEDAIKKFLSLDGISVLGASIVASANSPSTLLKTGTISTVMQHFSGVPATVPLDPTYVVTATGGASATAAAAAPTKKALQASSSEGRLSMVNFAPFCTISCLSTTAQSADGLIQFASGVTHRRARAPLWSYHFYPDESHTELLLQLPSAVLLKEVHLQPHAAGLSTCPSFVALEVSAYGPLRLTPACLPLPTSGLTHIRLHLPVPRVANCVLLRLYRPRDANSIGLLQVRLLGSHAFSGGGPAHCPDADDEAHCDHSLGWLRLLHHCLTLAAEPELRRRVVERASRVPNLLATCCGLLLVPSHVLPVYLPCLERVLREVALFSPENGMHTMRVLLESRAGVVEPLMVLDAHWQDRLINVAGYQSACELLFQICEHQDPHTSYRVKILLDWLEATSNQALATGNTDNCNPAYISSIASILWSAKHSQVHYDLESLVTIDLFRAVHGVRTRANCSTSLKHSIDSLMCSACHVRPELYALLLQQVGVPCGRAPSASISDDRKDAQGMTDDSKRHSGWYGPHLDLTREQLDTVALVSRSPTAVQQLLDSGLPRLLNAAILDFCGSATARVDSVTSVLQFFTDVSDEKAMRDWLGSEEGSSFWLPLLQWLCRKPSTKSSSLQTEALVYLEEVCVRFLAKCCLCHHQNQARLAKVLCDVIYSQSNGISGFMRRLILQLLLETEKIPVSVEADEALYPSAKLVQAHIPAHPAFKQTHNRTMLCLGTNTTLSEILEQHVLFNTTCKTELVFDKKAGSTAKKDIFKSWFAADEQEMSMAAGVTAKDKRAKDAKNMLAVATPQSKKKRYASGEAAAGEAGEALEGRGVRCEALSEQPLPLTVNLGQLLRMIEAKGAAGDWPYVHLKIYQCKNNEDKPNGDKNSSTFQQQPPICSALQVFSSMGGLALLAQHLPTIYPEAIRPPQQEKPAADQSDSDWIKVEDCDDMYEDMMEEAMGSSSPSKSSVLISHIPPHSLTAFGLFLRLPGYAEVLLKDMKRALYLLRLILGVTDDGEGGDIFNSPISDSLPTLPFEVLKKLYDATPLSTDDGRLLRRISINFGVVHLLLACLSIFTHHSSNSGDKDQNNKSKEERSQLYWAKGTGFGTGSTQQSWNVEQALMKQRNEEEHVTVLLQVLASYINPNDEAEEELGDNVLPLPFHELLTQSALLPAICSYLRNDSVLDMARHIPLYKAVLQLLRSLAVSSQLVGLLLPQKKSGDPSVSSLLKNMKTCVDTYASKLRLNSRSKSKSKLSEQMEDLEQGEGLATLMPDIQNTANLVSRVTSGLVESDCSYDNETSVDRKVVISLDEQYLRIMKNLQFASFEMISELPDGGIKFVVSHHFESNAKTTGEQSHPARVKRIAQEAVTLSTSLPLSYSSSVFVRYDTSRLDVMKVLITGPSDTPYANGCFELDVFFPPDYPLSPMMINLETTGHHTVRFNPNLYNDGKVCLSVLNTWHGRPEEKWNAQTSSFLQVLVSIQSLILVPEPYFNEPGYERARGTPAGTVSSRDYNLNICQSTVRWAMLEQILNPCPCFKDVVHAHFYVKRHEVIAQVERWIAEVEQEVARDKKVARSGKKSPASTLDTFRKVFEQLKDELAKLRPPPELEEEEEEEPPQTPTNDMEVAIEVHHEDEDKDMEKMVNEMCD